MILTSPFSRQSKNNQSWTPASMNGPSQLAPAGSRKPAPSQPAPQKPTQPFLNNNQSKFHTLNRLDQLRARQQQQASGSRQPRASTLQRNHFSPAAARPGARSIANEQIYAPASIASPNEYYYSTNLDCGHQFPFATNEESQHYAAASCCNYPTAADSSQHSNSRSGRESALGNLIEKFGTLRRKARKRFSFATNSLSSSPNTANESLTKREVSKVAKTNQRLGSEEPEQVSLDLSGKKQLTAEDIYAEGLRAIDGNCQKRLLDDINELDLNNSLLEGETKLIIDYDSMERENFKLLTRNLINWINDELAQERIIINDLREDLFDGLVLGKLIEKLHNIKLDLIEVTQNDLLQKYKLKIVLETINRILFSLIKTNSNSNSVIKPSWSVDGIHSRNLIEILKLLIALANHYKAPIKLPPNLTVQAHIIQKYQQQLYKRSQLIQLTSGEKLSADSKSNIDFNNNSSPSTPAGTATSQLVANKPRDVFDTLVEFEPSKLTIVKHSLVKFANRHLNKINISCLSDTASSNNSILDPEQFSDGLLLVFLISSLEDYFIPLGELFTNDLTLTELSNQIAGRKLATAIEQDSYINTQPIHKLHNVNLALTLIEEAGIAIKSKVRAEDIVNGDLKSVLRVLYALFSRYKYL